MLVHQKVNLLFFLTLASYISKILLISSYAGLRYAKQGHLNLPALAGEVKKAAKKLF